MHQIFQLDLLLNWGRASQVCLLIWNIYNHCFLFLDGDSELLRMLCVVVLPVAFLVVRSSKLCPHQCFWAGGLSVPRLQYPTRHVAPGAQREPAPPSLGYGLSGSFCSLRATCRWCILSCVQFCLSLYTHVSVFTLKNKDYLYWHQWLHEQPLSSIPLYKWFFYT